MQEQPGVALIGCGAIAPTHLQAFSAAGAPIVALCDLVRQRAAGHAAACGCPLVTTDWREVLRDDRVRAVSICTDHASHAEIAVAALEAGRHVLCEKPLGIAPSQLDAMLAAHARRRELVFGAVFQHRFDGVNLALRQLIAEGAFGTVLTAGMTVRCRRTDSYYRDGWHGTLAREGGSVLINQAIHTVDILAWLMGGVRSICAASGNLTHGGAIETEDTLTAAIRFGNGAMGTMEATCSSNLDWEISLAVHGSAGGVEVRNGAWTAVFEDAAVQRHAQTVLGEARDPSGVPASKRHFGAGHGALIADFVQAVRDGRQPFVTAQRARHAVDVVLAAYASAAGGGWVDVPAPLE